MKLAILVSRLSTADLDSRLYPRREYEQSNPTRLKYREEDERLRPNLPKRKSTVGGKDRLFAGFVSARDLTG
jgi:hypothetical protein